MDSQFRGKTRSNKGILATVSFFGLLLCYLTGYLYSKTLHGADSSGCRIVYMGPSYARINAFDESHTKFASKYSLYLYREQGMDPVPEENEGFDLLDGIPILFIPGNAGSYRQVRSIAAETSNMYFDEFLGNSNPNAKNYDFFTADFNEDFTAFHGRTLIDQAEYLNEAIKFILGLYENNKNSPKSVVILGHSMGGVVARVMVSLPNYVSESINTIITLASPHAAAPLTFDGDILKIYSAVDRFWFNGFHSNKNDEISVIARERVTNISLVSITGGLLDSVLPADYTTLGYLVPPTNGFTVFSTGIPNVWTPIDHLAIVWCGQLRRQISRILLEIADYSSPEKTYPLEKKMRIMRKVLLSGFEDYSVQDLESIKNEYNDIKLKLDRNQINSIMEEKTIKIYPGKSTSEQLHPTMNVFNLSFDSNINFSLLSSVNINNLESFNGLDPAILLCNNSKFHNGENDVIDYTTDQTKEYIALTCVNAAKDLHIVPRSTSDTKSLTESSFGGDKQPFHAMKFKSTVLSKYEVIIVKEPSNFISNEDFIIAAVSKDKSTYLGKDLFTLLGRDADISLPAERSLSVNIQIPGAWSSILAYKLKLIHSDKRAKSKQLFAPFIRQWSDEPYEVKWHVDIEDNNIISLSMHGIAPFTPFKIKSDYGLNIELWTDSTNDESPLEIILTVDFFNSLRLLVLRYRLAIVSYCVTVTLLVLFFQLQYYEKTNNYPNLIFGLNQICSSKILLGIFAVLSILTPIVKNNSVQKILNVFDPVVLQDFNEINLSLRKDFGLNSFFLGLEENCLWFIGPVFFIMSIGIVLVTSYLLLTIGIIISSLVKLLQKKINYKTINSNNKTEWLNRRLITTLLILLLISIYLPYQFAYMICCVIQIIKLIKLLSSNKFNKNLFNFQFTILLLMLWILPINIPILIVFVHDWSINWKTPFSSHHNILSIMPILLLMERNSSINHLPKVTNKFLVTKILISYFIFYSLVYGVRHTYWLHHLLNFFCCWLLVIYYDDDEENNENQKLS